MADKHNSVATNLVVKWVIYHNNSDVMCWHLDTFPSAVIGYNKIVLTWLISTWESSYKMITPNSQLQWIYKMYCLKTMCERYCITIIVLCGHYICLTTISVLFLITLFAFTTVELHSTVCNICNASSIIQMADSCVH